MVQPPTITQQSPKDYIIDPRENIVIQCEAKGKPAPRWVRFPLCYRTENKHGCLLISGPAYLWTITVGSFVLSFWWLEVRLFFLDTQISVFLYSHPSAKCARIIGRCGGKPSKGSTALTTWANLFSRGLSFFFCKLERLNLMASQICPCSVEVYTLVLRGSSDVAGFSTQDSPYGSWHECCRAF